jgi:hypothetical protein
MSKKTEPTTVLRYKDLTDDERAAAHDAIVGTWHTIAGDVFEGRRLEGITKPMPRSHVHEVVLDADHVVTHEAATIAKYPRLRQFFSYRPVGQSDEARKAAKVALPQKDWL